jgi:hypothetical protein
VKASGENSGRREYSAVGVFRDGKCGGSGDEERKSERRIAPE